MLTACGGGGGDGGTQLSASQAAYESLVLSPGAVYQAQSSLPDSQQGKPIRGTHYFSDQSASLLKSPLTNGPQRLSVGAWSTVSPSLDLPASIYQQWILFKGTPYQLSQQGREIKYLGGRVVESILTSGGDVISSQTLHGWLANPLSGAVASAADLPAGIPLKLFSNTTLLKPSVAWLQGAAFLTVIWNLNTDKYLISTVGSDTNVLLPLFEGSTIQQKIDANTLSFAGDTTKYDLNNGSIKLAIGVNTGVTTYVANSPLFLGDATSGTYRTFYELGGNVYVGSVQKSGALISTENYNTKARESIQAALNF